MAGEDPVTERAAVEWEAHMRAPVVDGVDLIPVCEQTDCVPVDVDDQPPGGAHLGDRCGAYQSLAVEDGHRLLLGGSRRQPRTSSKVKVKQDGR